MDKYQLRQLLQELLSLPAENEVVEFKSATNDFHFDKIGKYFSAICNEANLMHAECGWLIFGISPDHKVVGTNYRAGNRSSLDSLKGEIGSKTTNRITFLEIYEVTVDQHRVLMLQIPPAPRGIPVAWNGHYYGRDGEEISPLNLEEIERIRNQSKKVDWSAEVCPGARISDLDAKALQVARANFKTKNPRLISDVDLWDDITFLNKAKICVNGQITRAAIILLGKPESERFIAPAISRITWVLRDKENQERDYAHFTCPLLTTVDEVYSKIRNLRYRYMHDEKSLFPEEVDQYNPLSIREALNNCIAHQNYSLGGRINIVEHEDGYLTFTNLGDFLPGSIENVINSDSPPEHYRNGFLSSAMTNLNMIDTIGSGIKRMFNLQKERYFPMPDYDIGGERVRVTLTGKVLDMDYARVLARNPDLSLVEIMMLDKIQKKKKLLESEVLHLKEKGLIEGRKPNYHISFSVAKNTDQRAVYIKNRAFKDQHYKDLILKFIDQYGSASKEDIDRLILDILPSVLNDKQKGNKVRNLIYSMSKRDRSIVNQGTNRNPKWIRKSQNYG